MGHRHERGLRLYNPSARALLTPHHSFFLHVELTFVTRLVTGNEELVKWFLDLGADPNLQNDKGMPPLDYAGNSATTTTIALLLDHGAELHNSDALHAAARRDDPLPVLAYLLDRGYDINKLEHSHMPERFERYKAFGLGTALHCAARKGTKEAVQFLLDRGADREIRNSKGRTPADIVRAFRRKSCYEMFGLSEESIEQEALSRRDAEKSTATSE